jgi:hypothetical protein
VKFPVTIRHRTSKAKIYAPGGKFAYYRLAYTTAGKRRMQTFANYSDARETAERIVREMANGSQAAALNASQSRDALAAIQRLENFHQSTGRRYSVLSAVSELVEALEKLKGRGLGEAVEGLSQTPNRKSNRQHRKAIPGRNTAGKWWKPPHSGQFRRKFPFRLPRFRFG